MPEANESAQDHTGRLIEAVTGQIESQPGIFEIALADLIAGALRHYKSIMCDVGIAKEPGRPMPPLVTIHHEFELDWKCAALGPLHLESIDASQSTKDAETLLAEETMRATLQAARVNALIELTGSAAIFIRDGVRERGFLLSSYADFLEDQVLRLTNEEAEEAIRCHFQPVFLGQQCGATNRQQATESEGVSIEIPDWFEFEGVHDDQEVLFRIAFGVNPAVVDFDQQEAYFPIEFGIVVLDAFDKSAVDYQSWSPEDLDEVWRHLDEVFEFALRKSWQTTLTTVTTTSLADAAEVLQHMRQVFETQDQALQQAGRASKSVVAEGAVQGTERKHSKAECSPRVEPGTGRHRRDQRGKGSIDPTMVEIIFLDDESIVALLPNRKKITIASEELTTGARRLLFAIVSGGGIIDPRRSQSARGSHKPASVIKAAQRAGSRLSQLLNLNSQPIIVQAGMIKSRFKRLRIDAPQRDEADMAAPRSKVSTRQLSFDPVDNRPATSEESNFRQKYP